MKDPEEDSGLMDARKAKPAIVSPYQATTSRFAFCFTTRRVMVVLLLVLLSAILLFSFRTKDGVFNRGENDTEVRNPLLDEANIDREEELIEQEEGSQAIPKQITLVDKESGEVDDEEDDDEGEEGKDPEKAAAESEVMTLKYFSDRCATLKAEKDTLSKVDLEVASADCGWGYDFESSPAKEKPWKVSFFGSGWRPEILDLSGCAMRCPNSPKCKMSKVSHAYDLGDSDVVVVFQSDSNDAISKLPQQKKDGKKQYKVLYYREAVMTYPTLQTQKKFDFEMGVHYYSGIVNPNFLRKPGQYLSGAVYPFPPIPLTPVEKRDKFAISIISHCGASSQRDVYIDRLQSVLGNSRVDRFGDCSGNRLPGKSINMAFKLMARYKFYLSFENTIQDGYITEKLFFVLNVPVVPVYLGASNVPNITHTPAFIKVSDFHSPKALADYLLYLDAHPDEYMKYHEWRSTPSSFTQEYLDILQKRVAGPDELIYFKNKGFKRFPRTAQCCRLCDENYVKFATESRGPESLVGHMMSAADVEKKFFKGTVGR